MSYMFWHCCSSVVVIFLNEGSFVIESTHFISFNFDTMRF
jgi:hypothetical protein